MTGALIVWLVLMFVYCVLDFVQCVKRGSKRAVFASFCIVLTYPLVVPNIRWYFVFAPFVASVLVGILAALYVNAKRN